MICWFIIGLCTVMMIKNFNTYWAHGKITDAIYARAMECIAHRDFESVRLVDYDDMESYEATLFRIWDWGYSRILPKEKYEHIKPYI